MPFFFVLQAKRDLFWGSLIFPTPIMTEVERVQNDFVPLPYHFKSALSSRLFLIGRRACLQRFDFSTISTGD